MKVYYHDKFLHREFIKGSTPFEVDPEDFYEINNLLLRKQGGGFLRPEDEYFIGKYSHIYYKEGFFVRDGKIYLRYSNEREILPNPFLCKILCPSQEYFLRWLVEITNLLYEAKRNLLVQVDEGTTFLEPVILNQDMFFAIRSVYQRLNIVDLRKPPLFKKERFLYYLCEYNEESQLWEIYSHSIKSTVVRRGVNYLIADSSYPADTFHRFSDTFV